MTRIMKKALVIIQLLLICVASGFSQKKNEKPDFSGIWSLDRQASSGLITMIDNKNLKFTLTLTIEQKDLVFKVTRHGVLSKSNGKGQVTVLTDETSTDRYFLDGRGEINRVMGISGELMSVKTAQNGKKNGKAVREITVERPERMKLSAEESLRRTKAFDERREQFIATIRQGKN